MQIITGKYRARKLVAVESDGTRPTLARVKESVFNLIQDCIFDSVVLDLFAGSGAFGVECVSRGAKKVYFVDKTEQAIKAIKINTKSMVEDFEILKNDYASALKLFQTQGVKFDLVYLDPPYESNYALESLKMLESFNLLNNDAVIVVEHKYSNDLINLSSCYTIKKSKKYGIAYVDVISFNK